MLPTTGFTCSASSEYGLDFTCNNSYDSNSGVGWATKNEGTGAWIEIQLPEYVQLGKIKTRHRFGGRYSGVNFNDIKLTFSDGTVQSARLKDGTDPEWNVIAIDPSMKTKSIKIAAMSVHESHVPNPGFSGISFYSCPGTTQSCSKLNQV